MKNAILFHIFLLCICCMACTGTTKEPVADVTLDELPSIFPDYADVTIPPHIAPLRFRLSEPGDEAIAVLSCGNEKMITAASTDGQFLFPEKEWNKLLDKAIGKDIDVKVYRREKNEWQSYPTFLWHVSADPIDEYLVYRLIEPGYELWNKMGIYQRHITDYEQTPIIENSLTNHNCMNCHSFCRQDPEKMLFHMRAELPGTYIINGKSVEKLDTKAGEKVQSLVYPSWHPSGNFVAFSVNNTRQAFHMNDKNRIEVYDLSSDVVVYDVNKHEVVTDSLIFSDKAFETFPTFSPDGKTMYIKGIKNNITAADISKGVYTPLWNTAMPYESNFIPTRMETTEQYVFIPTEFGVVHAVRTDGSGISWQWKVAHSAVTSLKNAGERRLIVMTMDGTVTCLKY